MNQPPFINYPYPRFSIYDFNKIQKWIEELDFEIKKLEKRIVDIENNINTPLNQLKPTPLNEYNLNSYNSNYPKGNYIL